MRKLIFVLMFSLSVSYVYSQITDTRRFCIGMNFLGVRSEDKNFHFFKPFDKRFFPEIKYITGSDIADILGVNVQFVFESGLASFGFKYSYKPDSSYYMRSYGLDVGVGIIANNQLLTSVG